MGSLSVFLRYELLFLLTALIVIVTYRLLTNQINTTGLLVDKTGGRAFSPGRLQMLVATMSVAVYYMLMVMQSRGTGNLPNLPNEILMALGGSHLIYLGGKLFGMVASQIGLASPKLMQRFELPQKLRERFDPPENGG